MKAVLWDMDGTLFDTERIVMDCWERVCDAHGYANSRPILLRCIGRNIRESNEILRENFGEGIDIEAMRKEQKDLMYGEIGKSSVPVKAGITDALEWMATKGIPTALASSSDHAKIVSYLERSGLKKYFITIVGGDEVTQGKPHPEMYLTTAKKLGIEPKDCLVFEDSRNGVISASEAGMQVVMIPDLVDITDDLVPRVHYLLRSGTEIIPLLETIFLTEAQ